MTGYYNKPQQDKMNPSSSELGFYLTSSDRDLLNKVDEIMGKQGVVGLRDALGRIHYVVDGRKGSPYAARRINEAAVSIAKEQKNEGLELAKRHTAAIDHVLLGYRFLRTLRGYRFLRHMLQLSLADPSLLHPISKRLFPETGRYYRVSPSQVERNVRYLMDRLAEDEGLTAANRRPLKDDKGRRLSVSAVVFTLHDQAVNELQRRTLIRFGKKDDAFD